MTNESNPTQSAASAQRALADIGITRLEQLTEKTEAEVAQLHGMGPKGIKILRAALSEKGLSFRPEGS